MKLIAVCLLVQLISLSAAGDSKREPEMVHYSDIPERVQIIGKLGQPLGQLVTVRGRWAVPNPSKPASPDFVIDEVNGRLLDPPVKFSADFHGLEPVGKKDAEFTIKVGEEWELRGVETGGFVGFSQEVWREIREESGEHVAQTPPQGFLTRFCYVKAKRISSSKPTDSGRGGTDE
jgi:hypothetical protein